MEQPIVIEDREELIYLLSEASQLEHMVLCEYLYGSFSLKRDASEGVTSQQLAAITHWGRVVTEVAVQEMLHLALASNLLSAIGAAPNFNRPNFPQRAKYFPPGVQFALLPFGEDALVHFLFLERPEGTEMSDAPEFAVLGPASAKVTGREIVPVAEDYRTVGHLYRGIENGFRHLVDKYGERRVFIGSPDAQATQQYFGWPELIPVTDLASAVAAIEAIVEMGEGARGDWQHSHYGRFLGIYEEYRNFKEQDPSFEPARPVIPAVCRAQPDETECIMIEDPHTAAVADLCNAAYELMLQVLLRFFVYGGESDEELQTLGNVAVGLMFGGVRNLGRLLTTLPVGPGSPGKTAGATFEMFGTRNYLLPHKEPAWHIFRERLLELADDCGEIAAPALQKPLGQVETAFRKYAANLEAHMPRPS